MNTLLEIDDVDWTLLHFDNDYKCLHCKNMQQTTAIASEKDRFEHLIDGCLWFTSSPTNITCIYLD